MPTAGQASRRSSTGRRARNSEAGGAKGQAGANPLRIFVEIGFMGGRTGARTREEALAVARAVAGAPGLRPEYDANYYGAFVRDPDGNKIEAVTFAAT